MSHLIKRVLPLSLLTTSSLVFAGSPVGYDGWSASTGTIDTTASCSTTGVTCKTLASDNGFLYEQVDTGSYSYLRLIMTDPNATGTTGTGGGLAFSSETYVPFAMAGAGIVQGVASKQTLQDATDNFSVTAEVQKGNMRALGAATAADMFTTKLDQSFSNADLSTSFAFTNYTAFATGPSNSPDTNTEIGHTLDIAQNVNTGNTGDGKQQKFVQRQRKGFAGNSTSSFPTFNPGLPTEFLVGGTNYFATSAITTAGSITLPVTVNGVATTGSNTVSWIDGNDISTTWIAQSTNIPASTGADINYQNVSVVGASSATAVAIDLPTPTNPFGWDTTNFGTAPSLP